MAFGFGPHVSYYPEFDGELRGIGGSFWGSSKFSDVSFGFGISAEGGRFSPADSLDMGIMTMTLNIVYPIWFGDNGVFNIGVAGQGIETWIEFDGTTIAEEKIYTIMPHLSLCYSISEYFTLKLTWLPKLGDNGLEIISLGLHLGTVNI
jgi:hypothetical protein